MWLLRNRRSTAEMFPVDTEAAMEPWVSQSAALVFPHWPNLSTPAQRSLRWHHENKNQAVGLFPRCNLNGLEIHNRVKTDLTCNWRCPVSNFMFVSFVVVVYGENAFWAAGDFLCGDTTSGHRDKLAVKAPPCPDLWLHPSDLWSTYNKGWTMMTTFHLVPARNHHWQKEALATDHKLPLLLW